MQGWVTVLSIAALASVAAVGDVQADHGRSFTGGARAGMNIADLGGSTDLFVADLDGDGFGDDLSLDHSGEEGVNVGIYAHLSLTNRWGVRAEVQYSNKGAKGQGGVPQLDNAPIAFHYTLRYVAVPLLVVYEVPYDGHISPHLFVGPELGFLVDAKLTGKVFLLDADGNLEAVSQSVSLDEATRTIDIGFAVGVGVRFPISRGSIVLDVRYTQSLLPVIDEHTSMPISVVSVTSDKLLSRTLTLTAGWEL